MTIRHYIYISESCVPLEPADLQGILASSRRYNEAHEITGMLLYRSGSFMQLLEGDKAQIYRLMEERIARDTRHHSIYVTRESDVPQRSFAGWSMAFEDLNHPLPPSLEPSSDFLAQGFTNELTVKDLDVAHNLLLAFGRHYSCTS